MRKGNKKIARLRNAARQAWKKGFEGFVAEKPKGFLNFDLQLMPPDDPMEGKMVLRGIKTPRGFIERLQKRGFKVLGEGCYSTVLGKEGHDKVIKVTRNMDNWIDYVLWGSQNGYAGNFAPKVFSWKKFEAGGCEGWRRDGSWSVSVVERMAETLNGKSKSAKDYNVLGVLQSCRDNILAQVYMEDIAPGSADFFTKLHNKFYASDICGKNMMVRADGSFCLTDPVCGTTQITAKRYRSGDFTQTLRRYYCKLLSILSPID